MQDTCLQQEILAISTDNPEVREHLDELSVFTYAEARNIVLSILVEVITPEQRDYLSALYTELITLGIKPTDWVRVPLIVNKEINVHVLTNAELEQVIADVQTIGA